LKSQKTDETWDIITTPLWGLVKGGIVMASVESVLGGSSAWSISADEIALTRLGAMVNKRVVQIFLPRDQMWKRGKTY
jgi:hypothetical protein